MSYQVAFFVLLAFAVLITAAASVSWYLLAWGQQDEDRQRREGRLIDAALHEWPVHTQARKTEPELVGFIVETRDSDNLYRVIRNFRTVMGDGVPIYVAHGVANEAKLRAEFGDALRYLPLHTDRINIHQYSYLLTRPHLYAHVLEGRHILVFQPDSVLYENSLARIEDFYGYDYVGAPWNFVMFPRRVVAAVRTWHRSNHTMITTNVGNGGLSLRKRATFARLSREYPCNQRVAEDVYWASVLHDTGARLPSPERAERLFTENTTGPTMPLGSHRFLPVKFSDKITKEERDILTAAAPLRKKRLSGAKQSAD